MSMDLGLVSIVMPAYNCTDYITESIESVIAQTYQNWELIIVDDCSTDNTVEIVKEYMSRDDRIKLLCNEENLGGALTRNYALREAKGKWVAFLDSDDLWLPQKLENQINFMIDNNYDYSYTNYGKIDEKSYNIGVAVTGPKKVTKHMMFNSCYVGCLTVMYNAEKVGLIQINDISRRNDYAMWLKIIKVADCHLLDDTLALYRKRKSSVSGIAKSKLLKYHYYLFRHCEMMNPISATWYTCMNVLYKLIRDKKYVRKIAK